MGVGSTSSAGGIVFGDDLVDGGREVHEEIICEVSGRASKVSVVGLGKLCDAINESQVGVHECKQNYTTHVHHLYWVMDHIVKLTNQSGLAKPLTKEQSIDVGSFKLSLGTSRFY